MEVARKALVVVAVLGAGAGVGSVLFALVTPGELQKQSMLQVETAGLAEVGVCVGRVPVFWPRMQTSFLPAGDAGKGLAAQGRSGQDHGTGDGYPEGRRSHEGERGLEEKLDS